MVISEHMDSFHGHPVVDYDPDQGVAGSSGTAYRLTVNDAWEARDSGERIVDRIARFAADPGAAGVPALVIGIWEDAYDNPEGAEQIVATLVAARDRLTGLRALFLGDITYEECEISWIHQADVSPILSAYPALECLGVRGGTGLVLGTPRHESLRRLIVESGGLDGQVVRGIAAGHLPRLEHLELWLGEEGYGGMTTLEDLAPILDGTRFPALQYLGLRDSEIADELAVALAEAPVLGRIRTLDLSLGNLSDEGVRILLASPALRSLAKLDIHFHYISPELVEALAATGIEVDAGEPQKADDDDEPRRYIAHAE